MENLILILTVTIVHILALISPETDFIIAFRNTIQYSRKIRLWTTVGFGIGVNINLGYSFFGLTWMVAQSEVYLI